MNFETRPSLRIINKQLRASRIAEANKKGTHKTEEWVLMRMFFEDICVRCLQHAPEIHKDHIVPIYQGGSNSIRNLQPLCRKCNSSKGSENIDWRQYAATHLRKALPENYTIL